MIPVDAFQTSAADWLADNAADAPRDYGAICPPDLIERGIAWQRRIHAAGFAGIHWPTEYGGRGLVLAGGALLRYGTPERQAAHLPQTLAAEQVWCQLFSEPGAGSDLASLTTRADLDGDRYIINGQKVWCSGGRYSSHGILMARTRTLDEAPKHEGISFFVIPMGLPGVEVRPLKQMTGQAEFDEVFFTDVELPADHLLGPPHGGWGVGLAVLTSERGHIGTSIIGLERRLDQMIALGHDRNARRPERVWHAGRTRRQNRRRDEPGTAQHHRGTPARPAERTEVP